MAEDMPSSEFYWDTVVITVCNHFSAPIDHRPYRVTVKVVEVELASGSGTQRQWNSGTPEFH